MTWYKFIDSNNNLTYYGYDDGDQFPVLFAANNLTKKWRSNSTFSQFKESMWKLEQIDVKWAKLRGLK